MLAALKEANANMKLRGTGETPIPAPVLPDEVLVACLQMAAKLDARLPSLIGAMELMQRTIVVVTRNGLTGAQITPQVVVQVAMARYGKTAADLMPNVFAQRFRGLSPALDQHVVGMSHVKKELLDQTQRVAGNTHESTKPRLRILLSGSRGFGQTQVVDQYAAALGLKVVKFPLANYSTVDAGTKPGALINDIGAALIADPYTCFFFQDVEKLHPVFRGELVMYLSEAGLGSSANEGQVHFLVDTTRSTAILATTAGSEYVNRHVRGGNFGFLALAGRDTGSSPDWTDEKSRRLREAIEFEDVPNAILTQTTKVIPIFPPANRVEFAAVLAHNLDRVLAEVSARHRWAYQVPNRAAFLADLTERHYPQEAGYGPAVSELEEKVRMAAAEYYLEKSEGDGTTCVQILAQK